MFFSRIRLRTNIRDLSHLHIILRGAGYGIHQLLFDLFPGSKERVLFREELVGEQIPQHRGTRGEPIYYVVSHGLPSRDNPLFTMESKTYAPRISINDRLSFTLRANPTVARKEPGKKNSVRHDVVMDAQYHLLRQLARLICVDDSGEKSELKGRIFAAWIASNDGGVGIMLESILDGNERYRDILRQKIPAMQLFGLALKAAADSALEEWFVKQGASNGFVLARDPKRQLNTFQAEAYRWHALTKKGRSAGFSSVDFDGEIEVTDPALFADALFTGIGPAKAFGCGLMLVRRI